MIDSGDRHLPPSQERRLLQALAVDQTLNCDQVEMLLPVLVQAEAAGEDVDADPAYVDLVRHLDGCERCAELYAALVDDVSEVTDPTASFTPSVAPPTFFAPSMVRQTDHWVLRVRQGIARALELVIAPPLLAPKLATLSGARAESLFSDRITELAGAPLLAVALTRQNDQPGVRVAIRDADPQTRWRVRLSAGAATLEQDTDAQGVAQFSGLSATDLDQITLTCTELT